MMGALMRLQVHMAEWEMDFSYSFQKKGQVSSGQAVLISHQQWKEDYSGEGMCNSRHVEGRFTISQGVPTVCEEDTLSPVALWYH